MTGPDSFSRKDNIDSAIWSHVAELRQALKQTGYPPVQDYDSLALTPGDVAFLSGCGVKGN